MTNAQDLWQRDTDFAAAPDTFPPDRFNAGVMLLRPSISTLEEMKSKIESLASYDGGDTVLCLYPPPRPPTTFSLFPRPLFPVLLLAFLSHVPSPPTLQIPSAPLTHSNGNQPSGPQGFLNAFFPSWFEGPPSSRLPFRYNALRTMYHMTKKKPTYWAAVGR
jgi:hypothetical protein